MSAFIKHADYSRVAVTRSKLWETHRFVLCQRQLALCVRPAPWRCILYALLHNGHRSPDDPSGLSTQTLRLDEYGVLVWSAYIIGYAHAKGTFASTNSDAGRVAACGKSEF